jgi:hypothetical protein
MLMMMMMMVLLLIFKNSRSHLDIGFKIVIISDPMTIDFYFKQKECNLSSYAQLKEIGFDLALGEFNVFHGSLCVCVSKIISEINILLLLLYVVLAPTLDRKVLKSMSSRVFHRRFETSVKQFVLTRVNGDESRSGVDLFEFCREMFLAATIDALLGAAFRRQQPTFARAFCRWQDRYEQAIASATALPRLLSTSTLRRLSSDRQSSCAPLATFIERRMRKSDAADDDEEDEQDFLSTLIDVCRQQQSDSNVLFDGQCLAGIVWGLLTAAPKNSGIGVQIVAGDLYDAFNTLHSICTVYIRCVSFNSTIKKITVDTNRMRCETIQFAIRRFDAKNQSCSKK